MKKITRIIYGMLMRDYIDRISLVVGNKVRIEAPSVGLESKGEVTSIELRFVPSRWFVFWKEWEIEISIYLICPDGSRPVYTTGAGRYNIFVEKLRNDE